LSGDKGPCAIAESFFAPILRVVVGSFLNVVIDLTEAP
jgi:hypothetical protein